MADEVTKKTPAEEAAEHIIPEKALEGKGVSAQSNPMELPEDEAKAVFDQIAKEVIIPAFNDFVVFMAAQLSLIDWTKDSDKPISTAVQTALNNMDKAKHNKELRTGSETEYRILTDNNLTDALKEQLESAYKKEHEHSNKALLDGLKQADIDNWNGGNVLTKDNTKAYEPTLPYHPATVKFVADTVKDVGAADMTKAVYDPQNKNMDVFKYVDDAVKNVPTPDVSGQIEGHNSDEDAHKGMFAEANHNHDNKYAAKDHSHAEYAPAYTYGTTGLTAGTSALETGKIHYVYR